MNKIGIIVPYFGPLPESFSPWLKSACFNNDVDFHIITDQALSPIRNKNIFIYPMVFQDLISLAADKLGVKRGFSPYKLCDYKPAFGKLFSDIINEYEFWGHCDVDMVLGDLVGEADKYQMLQQYDKILDLGHLSVYRNTPEVNQLYCALFKGIDFWEYIKESEIIWVFDEAYDYGMGGINARVEKSGKRLFNDRSVFCDVDPSLAGFFDIHNSPRSPSFFSFDTKNLTRHTISNDSIERVSIMYAHFQKRGFRVVEFTETEGVIIPNHWGDVDSLDAAEGCLRESYGQDFVELHFYNKWKKYRARRKKWQILKELFQSPSSLNFIRSIL